MNKPKIMTIFGTRPEAIKMAPVVKALRREKKLELVITVTAQHREMLDQVLELFQIKPDYDLDIMQESQSLTDITTGVLKGLKNVYLQEKPDLVLVHGDTSTTFVGALASFYQQIKVGHVEAGLRTHDKYSPFPEEMNRHLTGVLADLHFSPTVEAKNNLLKEKVNPDNIYITGNTVVDALLNTVQKDYQFNNPVLSRIPFNKKKIILLTAHRRENLGQSLIDIFEGVKMIIQKNPEVEVIFPVHLNPEVRKPAEKILGNIEQVHLIEPLDYEPFANLMARSYLILTDSGGIQEEAPGLGKPVLVLRDTTERPEAVKAGTVEKVGTDREKIIKITNKLLNNKEQYQKMAKAGNPYGDGKASQRILNRILYEFNLEENLLGEFVWE
ncbi:MAG: non-hydrolyzing UDP-N-acetylglucosamine 2-epimerase [Halanaerobiales bacterium]